MPFALAIVGIVLLVAGVRNQQATLYGLLQSDFTGPNNFIYWLVVILVIGALGYIDQLQKLSVAFMVLLIVVLFLTKGNANGVGGGFFAQFATGVSSTSAPASTTPSTTASTTPNTTATTSQPAIPTLQPLPTFTTAPITLGGSL